MEGRWRLVGVAAARGGDGVKYADPISIWDPGSGRTTF